MRELGFFFREMLENSGLGVRLVMGLVRDVWFVDLFVIIDIFYFFGFIDMFSFF